MKTKNPMLQHISEAELAEELAYRRAQSPVKDLGEMENLLERKAVDESQQSLDTYVKEQSNGEGNEAKPCPRCGKKVEVKAKKRARRVRTVSGEVRFSRNYHYCEECKEGFYPVDLMLGLLSQGELSPNLEARVLDFGVNTPYEEASARWKVHYRTRICAQLFQDVVERVGQKWCSLDAQTRQERLTQGEESTPTQGEDKAPTLLVIQTDGSMVSTREGWKEVKVAVLYREEHHLKGNEEVRGQITEARYIATMGGKERFAEEVDAALQREQAEPTPKVIWLGDGAPSNWNLADEICPKAIQILDVMHALEHGMKCGKEVLGEDPGWMALFEKTLKHLLYETSPEQVLGEIEQALFGTKGRIRASLLALHRYYQTNQGRMKYKEYREAGYPIGSGTVESAHRHVIQSRMKRSGQHWNVEKGHQMAGLRAAYKTAGPEEFYETVRLAA